MHNVNSSDAFRIEPGKSGVPNKEVVLDTESKEEIHRKIEEQASSAPEDTTKDVFESGAAAIHQNPNRPPVSHAMSLFMGGRWGNKKVTDNQQKVGELKGLINKLDLSNEEQKDLLVRIDRNSPKKNVELEKKLNLFNQIKDDEVLSTLSSTKHAFERKHIAETINSSYITGTLRTTYKKFEDDFKHIQAEYQKIKKDPIYLRTELNLLSKKIDEDEKLSDEQKAHLQEKTAIDYGKKASDIKAQIIKASDLYKKMKEENPQVSNPTNVKQISNDVLRATLERLADERDEQQKRKGA